MNSIPGRDNGKEHGKYYDGLVRVYVGVLDSFRFPIFGHFGTVPCINHHFG